MRISGGYLRGRSISPPKDYRIRPTAALVKEAVFGKLQFIISNSKFLDLFSGSGSMGIEALSRGASMVHFNDASREAVRLIKANLNKLSINAEVTNYDYKAALLTLAGQEFDFIYIDPPYDMDVIGEIAELAYYNNTLKIGGILIYEHNRDRVLNFDLKHYIIDSVKQYSSTTVTYIKRID